MALTKASFIWAIGQQESGASYSAVNPDSGALGKYQVMPANIPEWTRKALGHSISTQEFLNSPSIQEQVVAKVLGDYYDQYGARGAAAAWYSGDASLSESTKPQPNGPTIKGYVDQVLGRVPGYTGSGGSVTTSTGSDFVDNSASSSFSTGNSGTSVEDAISSYGFVGTLADTVPELKNLLVTATTQSWTADKFTKAVEDTQWWKSHNEQYRQNIALKATDPAEYKVKYGSTQDHVSALVAQSGLKLHTSELAMLTGLAFNKGYTDDQINEFLSAHGRMGNGGQAGIYSSQLKEAAANYGVGFTRDGIDSAVRHIIAGHATVDMYTNNFVSQAQKTYSLWAKQIGEGQTVRQLADPYIQQMATTLELPTSKIDLYDPTIKKAMQSSDPEANSPSTLPMWKFEQQLKNDPRWDTTKNATDAAYQMVHQIGNDWGFST